MDNLLPFVEADIGFSLAQNVGVDDLEFVANALEEMKKENPYVAKFIEDWVELAEDDELHSMFCGIIVYKMLKSQAEVDRMEQEINI